MDHPEMGARQHSDDTRNILDPRRQRLSPKLLAGWSDAIATREALVAGVEATCPHAPAANPPPAQARTAAAAKILALRCLILGFLVCRTQDHGVSATDGHFGRNHVAAFYGRSGDVIGFRILQTVRIGRVLIKCGLIGSSLFKEFKRNIQRPLGLIADRTDKPDIAAATGDRDVLSDLGIQHPGVIPSRRHLLEEFEQIGFLQILFRRIGKRDEPGIDHQGPGYFADHR